MWVMSITGSLQMNMVCDKRILIEKIGKTGVQPKDCVLKKFDSA